MKPAAWSSTSAMVARCVPGGPYCASQARTPACNTPIGESVAPVENQDDSKDTYPLL